MMARKFEQHLEERLKADLDSASAQRLLSTYQTTRLKLIENIYSEIRGAEPSLSDHGESHIDNVLRNVGHLISDDHDVHLLNAVELYLLAMIVLFHDVGNLYGRENHHKKIVEIYDWARGTDAGLRRERTLIIKAAMAHTGYAVDGSADTLKELDKQDHLDGSLIRHRDLGAIVRFADELAEGPQRTSSFMLDQHRYDSASEIHHEYASITHIHIDRPNQRIRLTYELEIAPSAGESVAARDKRLRALLTYTYQRIVKLDQERRYTRYYCSLQIGRASCRERV